MEVPLLDRNPSRDHTALSIGPSSGLPHIACRTPLGEGAHMIEQTFSHLAVYLQSGASKAITHPATLKVLPVGRHA